MGDASILGIGRTKPVDPAKSGAAGDDGKVGDAPLKMTGERKEAEWEKVPATKANSRSYAPSSPAPPPTKGATQPQADRRDIWVTHVAGDTVELEPRQAPTEGQEAKNNKLDDLPLKGASTQRRSEQERDRSVQASGMAVQPASSASMPTKGLDERGKKAPVESDGPPRRPDEQRKQPPKKASKALWTAVVLLALALAGATGYGYLTGRHVGSALAQLPGMAQLLGTLQGRMDGTEAKLRDLTGDWASLAEQVAELSAKTRSSLENARQRTEGLIRQEQERIEAEMAERDRAINARLAQVESEQQAENERLAHLQDWTQKNVDMVQQELAAERKDRGSDLSALRQDINQNSSGLQRLARKVEPQRVDFEVTKKKEQELVPGIALTVTRTDVRYQRFDGYLELMEDSRTLWLSKVAAQQAVPFYFKQGSQPYDLVVTSVNRDGLVGYILVPNVNSSETASDAPVVGSQ
jgi:hypothetical protein